jgi:hypothetical protein
MREDGRTKTSIPPWGTLAATPLARQIRRQTGGRAAPGPSDVAALASFGVESVRPLLQLIEQGGDDGRNSKYGVGAGRRGMVWDNQVTLSPRRLALPGVNGRFG